MAPSESARGVLLLLPIVDLFSHVAPLQFGLDYHLERQNVLSSNLAHVDTPGYVPRDLAREGNFAQVLAVTMDRTQPGHLVGSTGPSVTTGRVFKDGYAGAGNDHNYVSLDREAGKLAANQIRYDVITAIVSAELADLAFAANDGRG